MKKPVVVLIFAHKSVLENYERVSLAQCYRILGKHPIRLVCPQGLDVEGFREIVPQIQVDFIPEYWLQSLSAYNRLKINPFLYERYDMYEFMLTYELDAFVFRDDLLYWCEQGWDYIGAPFFDGWYQAAPDAAIISGGNSGFSLRRILSARKVLRKYWLKDPISTVYTRWKKFGRLSPGSLLLLCNLATLENRFHPTYNTYDENEDLFWSRRVPTRFDWFQVADYANARSFSFETHPARLITETAGKLPFGCHKWQAENLSFWRSHIEAFGYNLP